MPEGALRPLRDGVRVAVRLTPRARADCVVALAATADGERVVRATVTAPPADGHANEALLHLLARTWLPRCDLAMLADAASRNKSAHISGDPQSPLDRLGALIAALPGP
ncbi:MAG: DUF167 family protein [Stellaceae bacterium]